MKLRPIQFVVTAMLFACGGSACAQSGGDTPLGDVARDIRKAKVATKPAEVRIDNDNFSNIMQDSEARRIWSMPPQLSLGFGPVSPGTPLASPDVSCSLSFSARGIHLTDVLGPPPDKEKDKKEKDGAAANNVPASELAKLEGPATIIGDSLQLFVYNGTGWQIEEITVGLTILRHPSQAATTFGSGRVIPASSVQIVAKRSDTMFLYHFKGSAAPNSRATFTEPLGISLGPDQEWHWAILDAKGTPPKTNDLRIEQPKTN